MIGGIIMMVLALLAWSFVCYSIGFRFGWKAYERIRMRIKPEDNVPAFKTKR